MFKITKRRIILVIIVLLILGGVVYNRRQSAQTQEEQIETTHVERGEIREEVTSSGKVNALKQVDLHFQTGGRLAWVGVKEGDQVAAYTAIASLDMRQLEKDFEKTLRDYSKERNDFEEDRKVTYQGEVLTNVMSDTVKRILEKNQWDLEKAVLDVEIKSISKELSTLVTPITGIVTHMDTPVAGVNLTAADTFTIVDPTSLVFTANIDETDIGKVRVGQKTEVHLDAYPDETFMGIVSSISFASETTAGGATVYPVDITLAGVPNLLVGLNGDVSIIVNQISETTRIPSEALREDEESAYVIKKEGDRYIKSIVKTGIIGEDEVEIVEGVNAGDEIVIDGFQFLPSELQ